MCAGSSVEITGHRLIYVDCIRLVCRGERQAIRVQFVLCNIVLFLFFRWFLDVMP